MITCKRYYQDPACRIVFEAVRLAIDAGETEIRGGSADGQCRRSRFIRDRWHTWCGKSQQTQHAKQKCCDSCATPIWFSSRFAGNPPRN